jgi:predicted regulator of Ras-like GTPase activity (Roadblock/LC7/MglB family)
MGVVGPDGFEIAALSTRPVEIPQLSALTSTLVAIAQAFMLQAGLQPSRHMILESPDGSVLLMSIPVGAATYSLFVISGVDTPLGRILPRARACAAEIGEAFTQASE